MLIELPQVEYSMADCQDLFVSNMDDDYDDIDRFNTSVVKNDDRLTVPQDRGVRGHLSDAEPFLYTSSSESDADVCFSDIEPARGVPSAENVHSTMALSERKTAQKDLALHSPGQLLGTPRDPSRRYEYPFPAGQLGADFADDGSSSSAASTPGLTPGEGCSLGLVALAATLTAGINTAPRSASLRMYLPESVPAPAPIPTPVPVAVPSSMSISGVTNNSNISLSPLSQVAFVPGPSSAPAQSINSSSNMLMRANVSNPNPGSSSIAAHPKLSRFNPANTPVPPGLRGRTRRRKSASVSSVPPTPRQAGMVASVSIPASVSAVAAASSSANAAVVPTTTVVQGS